MEDHVFIRGLNLVGHPPRKASVPRGGKSVPEWAELLLAGSRRVGLELAVQELKTGTFKMPLAPTLPTNLLLG